MRLLTDKQRKRKVAEVSDRLLLEAERTLDEIEEFNPGPGPLRIESSEEYSRLVRSAGWLLAAREEMRYEAQTARGEDD